MGEQSVAQVPGSADVSTVSGEPHDQLVLSMLSAMDSRVRLCIVRLVTLTQAHMPFSIRRRG